MESDCFSPNFAASLRRFNLTDDPQMVAIGSTLSVLGLTRSQRALKRSFDVVVSLAMLLFLVPLILTISLLIRLSSVGPILFRQPRVGFLDQQFICFKFRSMYHTATDLHCEHQTQIGDLRVTPVGRWLRRLSLDELPQLFNVLRGEMSLVGPRPHALSTKAGDIPFHLALDNYSSRHSVLPGMTGLAQIRGCRGRTATVDDIRRRVDWDLYYIRHWSLGFDLRILFGTILHLATYKEVV